MYMSFYKPYIYTWFIRIESIKDTRLIKCFILYSVAHESAATIFEPALIV